MDPKIGIRREDKNEWERRVPIIPAHAKELKDEHGIHTLIQPSKIRIFADELYANPKLKYPIPAKKSKIISFSLTNSMSLFLSVKFPFENMISSTFNL